MDTRDVELTPLSDVFLGVPSGESRTIHHVWNGTNPDPDQSWIRPLPASSDPPCSSDTVGLRVRVYTAGELTGETAKAGIKCGDGKGYIVVIRGGHFRDNGRDYEQPVEVLVSEPLDVSCRQRGTWPTRSASDCPKPRDPNQAPTLALQADDASDRLTVSSADSDADWNRLAIKASAAGTSFKLNSRATATDTDVATGATEITDAPDPVSAGEFIEFCADAATAASMTYTLTDVPTNTVVRQYTFNAVSAC